MKTITIKIKNPIKKADVEYFKKKNLKNFEIEINGIPISQVKRFAIDLDQEKMSEGYHNLGYILEKYLDVYEECYDETDVPRGHAEMSKYWED